MVNCIQLRIRREVKGDRIMIIGFADDKMTEEEKEFILKVNQYMDCILVKEDWNGG